MITALDANVVLDALVGTTAEIESAHAAMRTAKAEGEIVISAVAFAEVAARFKTKARADDFFSLLGCKVEPLDATSGLLAGQLFRQYKKRGGTRSRIFTDFLIAAHAQLRADRILTRDGRFFSDSFPRLKAVSPADLV